ncbi:MAG: chemotaxis protein CheW [Candidatus Protochlamydia sp.]|nr:chemotaxis protein CheW [Candidatus Protochlamydia sp.]
MMLLLHSGQNRYVIDNKYVVRIFPHVFLKKLQGAPSYIAGLMYWEGKGTPVLDFCELIEQRKPAHSYNTRIILINDQSQTYCLGILAEKVSDILPLEQKQFFDEDLYMEQSPFLDGIFHDAEGIIQRIDVEELFKFLSSKGSLWKCR